MSSTLGYAWKAFVSAWREKKENEKQEAKNKQELTTVTPVTKQEEMVLSDVYEAFAQLSEKRPVEEKIKMMQQLRQEIISELGEEEYGNRLEEIENDLFMAYKEADYHILRAEIAENELQYYKEINNPALGKNGNQLKSLWDHIVELKTQLEQFEAEMNSYNQSSPK